MKLCKFQHASLTDETGLLEIVGLLTDDSVVPLQGVSLTELLESEDAAATIEQTAKGTPMKLEDVTLLAPLDQQEVWAAGVTYKRSQTARMEESEAAASCYDRVYEADRPELFFKATPARVVGPGGAIRIRQDATWNVPEPELTLVMNSKAKLVGFTVGNDMSSRDIEGENPLYLPQAKTYDQCAGVGPCITLASAMPADDQIGIQLRVMRDGAVVFTGETSTEQMARTFEHLMGYLWRDNTFANGVYLMTGTGIVPIVRSRWRPAMLLKSKSMGSERCRTTWCSAEFPRALRDRVTSKTDSENRVEDLVSGFERSRNGATDLAHTDSSTIGNRDLDVVDVLLNRFDLHFNRPAKVTILHSKLLERFMANHTKRPKVTVLCAPETSHQPTR